MAAILMRSMQKPKCQVKVVLKPPSPDIGLIAYDLQRSVNILDLQLDAAADDADAHDMLMFLC